MFDPMLDLVRVWVAAHPGWSLFVAYAIPGLAWFGIATYLLTKDIDRHKAELRRWNRLPPIYGLLLVVVGVVAFLVWPACLVGVTTYRLLFLSRYRSEA